MQSSIQDFINSKRLAVVGVSRGGKKFGNMALTELAGRGYQVFAVHPSAQEINGVKCYPDLKSLQGQVEGVLVSVSPQQGCDVLREAAEAKIKNVWLQQGAESPQALALAEELGLNLVTQKCILMYAPPVRSVHRWHRAIMKLFGKL
ncbi:MAG: CoA-binding protein [Chloroflexota bacterium]